VSPLYARVVVALRVLVPLAWIAAAVLATIALPPLGATGSAPLDDLVTSGGGAAQQQQSATERFGFPLYTDTLVVQHDPRGLPPGTRERDARAALAVGQHQTPDLPQLRLVLPISDPKATTAINYLFFDDAANLDERRDVAERYASKHLGGVAVVGTTGAAPARLAQYDEIQSALQYGNRIGLIQDPALPGGAAHRHRAEAKPRHFEAGLPESDVLHARPTSVPRRAAVTILHSGTA